MTKSLLVVIFGALLALSACSQGGDSSDSGSGSRTFDAAGEAKRLALLHRNVRDVVAIIWPYSLNGASLMALDGVTKPCLDGGTVITDYNDAQSPQINRFSATFNHCAEAIGEIHGTLNMSWNGGDPNSNSFGASWDAQLAIDGLAYNIKSPSHFTSEFNPTSGARLITWFTRTQSSLQPPEGLSIVLQDSGGHAQRISTSDPEIDLSNVYVELDGAGGKGTMWLNAEAGCAVEIGESSGAVLGVTNPVECGYTFERDARGSGLESVSGTGTTHNGVLDLQVHGTETHLQDSGLFMWEDLVSDTKFALDGI